MAQIGVTLLDGLDRAHEAGFVHRDLKPREASEPARAAEEPIRSYR